MLFRISFLLLLGLFACGTEADIDIENAGEHAMPITHGQIDHGHPAVGEVYTTNAGCTGTLIGRKTVLTAAHCTKKPGTRVWFYLGNDRYDGTAAVIPEWRSKYRDLSLVHLDEPVDNVKPMPICDLRGSDLIGVDVTIVGFGRKSAGSQADWIKRKGTSTIYATQRPGMMHIRGTSHTCFGDSGGPALLSVPGRGECIVGVSSWLFEPYCHSSEAHTRPDNYMNWVNMELSRRDSCTWHRSKRVCTTYLGGIRRCQWQHDLGPR